MTSFGVKNNREFTFAFLCAFGIGDVGIVPAYVFSTRNKTGCFFVYSKCSGDTLAGQPSQKVLFLFLKSFKKYSF